MKFVSKKEKDHIEYKLLDPSWSKHTNVAKCAFRLPGWFLSYY